MRRLILATIWLLTACSSSRADLAGLSPLSPLESPLESQLPTAYKAMATSTPVLPMPTPEPTQTSLPTLTPQPTWTLPPTNTPWPTPVPTLASAQISPEAIAAMSVWKEAGSGVGFTIHQISQTPLGVTNLEWSPNGRNLWLNVATGPGGWGNIADTTSLVVNSDTHVGWMAADRGDWETCYRSYEWSPDGHQLAYLQDHHIQLVDTDGQSIRRLAVPNGFEGFSSAPRYSSDGKLLAVVAYRSVENNTRYDLLILDVVTGDVMHKIADAGYGEFTWSPYDNTVAHVGLVDSEGTEKYPRGVDRLWIGEVNTGRTVQVDLVPPPGTEGCLSGPAWLLNGEKVLVTVLLTPGIWIVDRAGNVQRLDEQSSQQSDRAPGFAAPFRGGICDGAVASPDGQHVVYTGGKALPRGLQVIDLKIGKKITLGSGDLCYGSTKINWAPHEPHFLRWGDNLRGGNLPLDLVNALDGSVTQLAMNAFEPAWSPDGRRIAYWQATEAGLSLYLLNLDDMRTTPLTAPGSKDQQWKPYQYDTTPYWSPDGQAIAFVSWRDEHPEAYVVSLTRE